MTLKRILPDLVAIVLFALLSFVYFFPADTEGRVLFQHDTAAGVGIGQEAKEYYEQTGERTRWTNSVFGGMPTYQISPSYDSSRPLQWVQKAYQLFLPQYVQLTFILMLGFYILLRAFGLSVWLSTLGGILWAFSSYFFILISAGHIWKFITLAYIPPTLAGIVLAYRGRLLAGGLVAAVFVALQIASNHVQMSYYFLFVILFIVGAYFEQAWREKTLPQFFRASAVTGEAARQASSGLDRDYITQWSYGIGETWTLLIPNFKGGASVPLSQSETAMEKANPMYSSLYSQLTQYFGDQPMTAGPVYVGAFVLFLFLLGCFIVKGPLKWALIGATLFSIVLSWGKNFMPLTDFFIDYVPMYNKFRAVSSILVIAENLKALGISLLLTAGVALWYAVPSSGGSYVPAQEAQMLQQAVDGGMIPASELNGILANLGEMRAALVQADALRSFLIIAIGLLLLMLYTTGKLRQSVEKYPDYYLQQDACRRADPAGHNPGLPRAEPDNEHLQREQHLLLAQECGWLPSCQAAPLPRDDRAPHRPRNAGCLLRDSPCRRQDGQCRRLEVPRAEHAEHPLLHPTRWTAGTDRAHPEPLRLRQRVVCRPGTVREQCQRRD